MEKVKIEQIKKVFGTNVKVRCVGCQEIFWVCDMYADLSGKPFIDYYCKECKEKLCGI